MVVCKQNETISESVHVCRQDVTSLMVVRELYVIPLLARVCKQNVLVWGQNLTFSVLVH